MPASPLEETPSMPRVTPLSLQDPDVSSLLHSAECLEQEGTISALARDRYEAAMRQYYEPYKPQLASIETLSFEQLKLLCGRLKIQPPFRKKFPFTWKMLPSGRPIHPSQRKRDYGNPNPEEHR